MISKAPGNTASDILLYYNTTSIPNQAVNVYSRTEIPGDGYVRIGSFPSGWGTTLAGYYHQEVMMYSINHTASQIVSNVAALKTKWVIA